jgi:hypothetical protein
VEITAPSPDGSAEATVKRQTLWDRKVDGGFPETKELKRRVRDVIQPGRNLGHVDRDYGTGKGTGKDVDRAGAGAEKSGGGTAGTTVAANESETGGSGPCSVEGAKDCKDCE